MVRVFVINLKSMVMQVGYEEESPNTRSLREHVLSGITLVIAVASLIVSGVNYLKGHFYFAAMDFFLFSFCLMILLQHVKRIYFVWHRYAITYLYVVAISLVSISGGLVSGMPFWLLTIPILLYLLSGKKHGMFGSGLVLVTVIYILYSNTLNVNEDEIVSILVNLILSYLTIWTTAHIYEANREKNELALIKLAKSDPLTNANNRRALYETYQQNFSEEPVAIALLDIDHFKCINDKYGHDIGDHVLIKLTSMLIEHMGKDSVFRIGGEEFAILLQPKNELSEIERLDKLRSTIEQTSFDFSAISLSITVSIGISSVCYEEPLSQLLKSADKQLYQAKSYGRNHVCSQT